MLGLILFWFIIIYVLYKFIVGFVLPIANASIKMKATMKHMKDEMEKNNPQGQEQTSSTKTQIKTEKPNGEYIDFEEIK
jgi:hypothetical protein